jgi:hypothetical protein
VPNYPDDSSKPVILEETLLGEVNPVVLGEASVSVYEIRDEKKKLPVDDWVDVEDLGMDDNTHPEDVGPVEMTKPAPRQKVWLASDVHRTSPVPFSEVDTTTTRPGISTARTPRAQLTRRQGRSMGTPQGDVISEARIGTILYMAVWVMFLCILLTMLINPEMALSDHDRQVIAYDCKNPSGIQAYDTSELNHWCDLNPLIDSINTDITLTKVSYVLLQKVPRVRTKIRTCKITKTVVPLYCGQYDHQTMVTPLAKWGVPSRVPVHNCQQWWLNKEYNSAVSSRHPLMVNATTIILVETVGRTWVKEEGEVKCKGEKFDYKGKHYEDLVIIYQIDITLVEDTALINPDGTPSQ